MAVVVPRKGGNDYGVAEVKKFIYECGRTFGVLQYDQESPLRAGRQTCVFRTWRIVIEGSSQKPPAVSCIRRTVTARIVFWTIACYPVPS